MRSLARHIAIICVWFYVLSPGQPFAQSAAWLKWNMPPGDELSYVNDTGYVARMRMVSAQDGVGDFAYVDGCNIRMHVDGFSPRIRSSGCFLDVDVKLMREGRIFPLAIGKSEKWLAHNSEDGSLHTRRACSVTEEREVLVPVGRFDVFVIECVEADYKYSTMFSKALGVPVVSMRQRVGSGSAIGNFKFVLCGYRLSDQVEDAQENCTQDKLALQE